MKKHFVTTACIAGLLSLSALSAKADVSEKVLKSFHSVFSKASNIQWTEHPDHYYVSFDLYDVMIRASYDMEGNMLSSIRYYKEQHLPLNILFAIKKSYPSKTIHIVTEVSTQDGIAYFIQLKDNKSWAIIKSDASATFEVVEKFKNAQP